jgi:hypothetical protein
MTTPPRPAWLTDALEVAERRAGLLLGAVAAVLVLGVILAIVVPDVVPPTPWVGAGVAIAAILLGMAVTLAVDAGSATIRGPRDVAHVGADLVAVLPSEVTVDGVRDLAVAVLDARPERRVTLGLAGTSAGVDVVGWTDALGVAVAQAGASVLVVDLASGATPGDGVLEVVREGVTLGRAVTFENDIKLARLGAGRDLDGAVEAAATLPDRLPKDLEVLIVGLPPVTGTGVVTACAALDTVLVGASAGETPRVRLQAGVEAIEGAGGIPQVILVDDRAAAPRDVGASERSVGDDGPVAPAEPGPSVEPGPPVEPEVPDALDRPDDRAHPDELDGLGVLDDPAGTGWHPVPEEDEGSVIPEPGHEHDDGLARGPRAAEAFGPRPVDGAVDDDAIDAFGSEPLEGADEVLEASGPADGPDAPDPAPSGETPASETVSETVVEPVREDLSRSPAPSVRIVRGVPPTRARRDDAGPLPPPTATPGPTPAGEGEAPFPRDRDVAAPRDPQVIAGAAAAALAARLAGSDALDAVAPAHDPREHDAVRDAGGTRDGTVTVVRVDEPVLGAAPVAADETVDETDDPAVADPPAGDLEADDPAGTPGDDDPVAPGRGEDPTDELPAVTAARLERGEVDPEDDPLRTTAQLAFRVDELDDRGEGAGGEERGDDGELAADPGDGDEPER